MSGRLLKKDPVPAIKNPAPPVTKSLYDIMLRVFERPNQNGTAYNEATIYGAWSVNVNPVAASKNIARVGLR
jgi:hypothetical protein